MTGIERAQKGKKRRRRMRTLDKYVLFSITAILAYTACERYIAAKTGVTADTLTTCFFAAFAGEILSCCLIKMLKLKNKEDEEHE